jgi:hypothetical protein
VLDASQSSLDAKRADFSVLVVVRRDENLPREACVDIHKAFSFLFNTTRRVSSLLIAQEDAKFSH